MKTQRTGKHAEDLALTFLENQKLRLLERNYYCRYGEADLIMCEGDTVVVIEVRYRRESQLPNVDFGGALESVDSYKQARLVKTATHYLQAHKLLDCPARIDVFALNALNLKPGSFRWVRNAVEA